MVKVNVRRMIALGVALAAVCAAFPQEQERVVQLSAKDFPELPTLNPNWRKAQPEKTLVEEEKAMRAPFNEYRKLIEKASQSAMSLSLRKEAFEPTFYRYTVSGEKFLSTYWEIEKRCALCPGTLASLNGIGSANEDLHGKTLIVPAAYGLFISPEDKTDLGIILYKKYASSIEKNDITRYTIDGVPYYYIPNVRFGMEEMFFFTYTEPEPPQQPVLDNAGSVAQTVTAEKAGSNKIRLPLSKAVLTSPYGERLSPVYGTWKKHGGVDLAAPTGTPVYACMSGTVSEAVANHEVFGNVIVIKHTDGYSSTYAHLSKMNVKRNQAVTTQTVIGLVGQTGAATGPHLHFEIRKDGATRNPADFLNIPS